MGTPTKDYSVYCGHKYNMLTVLGVKPRELDAKGKYKPARLIVRCDCGRVYDAEAAAVIHGRQKGCICQRGRKDYREPNPLAPENFPTSRAYVAGSVTAPARCARTAPRSVERRNGGKENDKKRADC